MNTPGLEIQLKASVRAIQSTPLVSRSGTILGMFSTHYTKPYGPDDRALALLDVSMPGMDGIQATRVIHQEMPEVKIIGLSMFLEGEQAAAIRDAGAVNYLAKTGPSEAVIEAIRNCAHANPRPGQVSSL